MVLWLQRVRQEGLFFFFFLASPLNSPSCRALPFRLRMNTRPFTSSLDALFCCKFFSANSIDFIKLIVLQSTKITLNTSFHFETQNTGAGHLRGQYRTTGLVSMTVHLATTSTPALLRTVCSKKAQEAAGELTLAQVITSLPLQKARRRNGGAPMV